MRDDVEHEIEGWRQQMSLKGVGDEECLAELEAHLRDAIEAQRESGSDAAEAFQVSAAALGSASLIKREFAKVGGRTRQRLKSSFFTLAGIPPSWLPHPQLQLHPMNTVSTILEPRWATYTKAAVFLFPAVLFGIFSKIWLMPKMLQVSAKVGAASRWPDQVATFFFDYGVALLGLALLLIAALEWKWSGWARLRKISVNVTVWLLNGCLLVGITILLINALVLAAELAYR